MSSSAHSASGPTSSYPAGRLTRLAVIGAGTMGAGIAAVAVRAGMPTTLCDVDAAALARGTAIVHDSLERARRRGRLDDDGVATATGLLAGRDDVAAAVEGATLVLEAVPERLELKRDLLARAAQAAPGAVLASNTSSLPIAQLAAGLPAPGRLVGLHFFNPPQAMRLVELVRTDRTDADAVATARAVAERMGKLVVDVADGPGFLVNRCARPFYLEALRLVEDGVATPAQIDRICRLGAGFPMGPFELMDVVGLDVSLAVTRSMHEQAHGEPRWRPSPLQVAMAGAGRLGRKAGGGFYPGDTGPPPPDAAPQDAGPPPAAVAIVGAEQALDALRQRVTESGVAVHDRPVPGLPLVTTVAAVAAGHDGPVLMSALDTDIGRRRDARAVAFSVLEPAGDPLLVELGRGSWTDPGTMREAVALLSAAGLATEVVTDAAGGVLGRIVAGLVNEAAFAIAAGVAGEEDVDRAMVVGLGHPRGPLTWGAAIGFGRVVAVLDQAWAVEHDPRYRVAPGLRRRAWAEEP